MEIGKNFKNYAIIGINLFSVILKYVILVNQTRVTPEVDMQVNKINLPTD